MKRIKLTEFTDPGHGWLSVPRSLIISLGLKDKITGFSYQKGNRVYLEEDCDCSIFYDTFFAKQGLSNYTRDDIKSYFEVKDSWTNNQSPVRYYQHYQP